MKTIIRTKNKRKSWQKENFLVKFVRRSFVVRSYILRIYSLSPLSLLSLLLGSTPFWKPKTARVVVWNRKNIIEANSYKICSRKPMLDLEIIGEASHGS